MISFVDVIFKYDSIFALNIVLYILVAILTVWILGWMTLRLKSQSHPKTQTKSSIIIGTVYILCFVLNCTLVESLFYHLPTIWYTLILMCLILVQSFHLFAFKSLKDNFADSEYAVKNGKLITSGLYSFVRHPIYTVFFLYGVILLFVTPVIVVCLLMFTLGPLRIAKEEKLLIQQYGQEYLDYCNQVRWRMIPWIY